MTRSQSQGFLALPPSGEGPGVLVLHAWWGLNDTIKAFCKRLAESGFVAFAPDLYHGKVADNIPDAEALGHDLDANHLQAKAEIAEAIRFLDERNGQAGRGLAAIGVSLGAYYALDLAAADPEHIHSVVLFYGTGGGDFSSSRAAYLGHFAENDELEPRANVDSLEESLRQAGCAVTFHVYSGTGHWFFEPDRSDAYDPEAAALAWKRTLSFLRARSADDRGPFRRQPSMKPTRIRRGNISDAPALAAFAARTFFEAFGADSRPEDVEAHLASSYGIPQQTRELTDPDVVTLLAHQDDVLVAYAQVRRKVPPPCVDQPEAIELQRFYVDRPAHGSGVAALLMSAVHDVARERGAQHLWLSTWERNPRGIAFYKKVGFQDVGSTDFYVGSDRQTDRVLVAVVRSQQMEP